MINFFASGTAATNVFLLLFGILLIVVIVGFWLWMLIDIIRRPIKNQVLWFLIVFFLGVIGALVYYFVGRNQLTQN